MLIDHAYEFLSARSCRSLYLTQVIPSILQALRLIVKLGRGRGTHAHDFSGQVERAVESCGFFGEASHASIAYVGFSTALWMTRLVEFELSLDQFLQALQQISP